LEAVSPDIQPVRAFTLEFKASTKVLNDFILFISYPVCGIVIAA
jgi:hypothetical protein